MKDTILDYATPSASRTPRRAQGVAAGGVSFALSLLSAAGSFTSAHSIRYPVGRDCFDVHGTTFWVYSPILGGLAAAGLLICMKLGAGIVSARVGLLVAAFMWIGALLVYWP